MKRIIKNYFRAFIAFALAATLLFPIHFASALFGIDTIASSAVEGVVSVSFWIIYNIIGRLTVFFIGLFDKLVYIRIDSGLPVINQTWTIFRNFSNMLFIVLLVWMSFALIFRLNKYRFSEMIWRLILAAVLINFSLAIAGIAIDASQVLTNVFLAAIGDPGNRLGQYLNPSVLLDPKNISASTLDVTTAAGASIIFYVIISAMFLFGLMVATVFALFRIFVIWGLLMVSPLFWMAIVLPGTRKWFRQWWSWFLGWILYLPIYLFFLYIGMLFLAQRDSIFAAVSSNVGNPNAYIGSSNITLNIFVFYVFATVILSFSSWAAIRLTRAFGGSGFEKGLGWARSTVGKVTGYNARKEGLNSAVTQRFGQFRQEGFKNPVLNKIYGGKEGDQRIAMRYAERLNVRGAGEKVQKEFLTRAGRFYDEYNYAYENGKLDVNQISALANKYSATDPRGFAYRKLAARLGQLDNGMFTSTLRESAGNQAAIAEFMKAAKESKFSKMKGGDLAKMASAAKGIDPKTKIAYDYSYLKDNVAARREMYRYVQSDPRAISGMADAQLETGLELFGGHTTAEGKAFMKEVGKIRPDFVMNYNLSRPDTKKEASEGFERQYKTPPANDFQLKTHMLGSSLKSGDAKTTAGIKKDVWETPEFKEALKFHISQLKTQKARQQYVSRLERSLMDSDGGTDKINILYNDVLGPTYAAGGAATGLTMPSSGATPPI